MENKKIINSEEIKHYIQQEKIQYIKVGITDVDGVLRGKYMHSEKFMKALEEGFGFCDVIFGWDLHDELYIFRESKDCSPFTGWHTGFPDTKIRIIFNSMREIPFEERTPLFLSELESPALCPRGVLKKVLERLKEKGFLARAALEYEFFLFNETSRTIEEKEFKNLENYTPGMFGYSILRNSVRSDFFQDILSMCSSMDMSLEGLHTETGPGVIEAAISVDEALLAADKATIFKTFMKVSPPLRKERDRNALIQGIKDGLIDVIVSDHKPEDEESKRLPFAQAAEGSIGIETLLSLSLELYHNESLPLKKIIETITYNPAKILKIDKGTLKKGSDADLCIFDLNQPWKVDVSKLKSKSKNAAIENRKLQGKVLMTYLKGESVFSLQ